MTNLITQTKINQECVKCGKCLSVCPFYKVFTQEENSPRGRLVIFQNSGKNLSQYCLGCLKCKEICPFELSPIEFFSPEFIWKNVFVDLINDYLKTFFDLIYNPKKKPVFYSQPKNLLKLWAIKRGFLSQNEISFNQNDVLYNPFFEFKYKNSFSLFGESKKTKEFWQKILKESKL